MVPDGAPPDARVAAATRVVLRPLATPLPLGFLALMVATTEFAALQLGWIPQTQAHVVGLVALVLAAPLQFLAAVIGFLSRDPVAASGLGILAGTWAITGLTTYLSRPATISPALGVLLVAAGVAMVVPAVLGAAKLAAGATMGLVAVRFALTGAYELSGSAAWKAAAGWAGIALAVMALYAAVALELEGRKLKTLLPVGRSGLARRAMGGDAAVDGRVLAREPGVRARL